MKIRILLTVIASISLLVVLNACSEKDIVNHQDGDYKVTMKNQSGKLIKGENDITVEITDDKGNAVDAKDLSVHFMMPAMPPSMPEVNADLGNIKQVSGKQGVYTGHVNFEETCTFQVTVKFKVNDKEFVVQGFSVKSK